MQQAHVPLRFQPCLYGTVEHLASQGQSTISSFYLFHEFSPESVASLHCSEQQNGNWISPPKAPFGGVECDADCTYEGLAFLISCVERLIISKGGISLTIKTAPLFYQITKEISDNIYVSAGYVVQQQYINHSIPVTKATFESDILAQEKRRLNKCRNAGFTSALLSGLSASTIYNFLKTFRLQKGYSLSLSESELTHLLEIFPDRFLPFGILDNEKIIALTIAVVVNEHVIYNFLAADLEEYRTFSPIVMLSESLYRYCQKEDFKYLDLGVSVDHDGNFKPSLARFKKNIGGVESEKVSYVKVFSLVV